MGFVRTCGKEDGAKRFTKPIYADNSKKMIRAILEFFMVQSLNDLVCALSMQRKCRADAISTTKLSDLGLTLEP